MQRGAWPACKKQTAFLLRLADFCFAPRRVLAKTGALRQTQLPVSSAGRGRCVCPCSASAVSAAGSASAAQPSTLLSVSPLPLRGSPLALSRFLRRAAAGACKNRSAAPASPRCICRRQRSAQLPPVGGLWASDCFLHRSASRRIVCPKLCRSPAGFRFPPSRP